MKNFILSDRIKKTSHRLEMFANPNSQEEFVSRTYKEHPKLNHKPTPERNERFTKWAKDVYGHFAKESIWILNREAHR